MEVFSFILQPKHTVENYSLYMFEFKFCGKMPEEKYAASLGTNRRMAENGFAPPLGNFADISYLVEN